MSVQVNLEDFAKPWRPGIYPKSTTVIYDNQLWILNDTITGLFTSSDFLVEVAKGDWIGRYTTERELNLKLDKITTVDVEKVYIKNADGTQGMKASTDFTGSLKSYFIDWEGYIQFTQNPTEWYNRALGPQNVYWTSQFSTSIGTDPKNFDARTNCKILPFDCKLISVNARISQNNLERTINIKAYKFDFSSGSKIPTGIIELMNLSVIAGSSKILTEGTDFTINSADLTKGSGFLFVVNQLDNLSDTAVNISMNFEFEKI
jgi:hypothetical protein